MGQGVGFYVFDDIRRTKKRREKRKVFDANTQFYQDDGINNTFPKLTSQMRQQIRVQISEEQKVYRKKLLVRLGIATVIFGFILYYLLFKIEISESFSNLFSYS
ncbi:hypothetical protein [Kordia zhangzhouensis]|uniref:hypothetical protein n=1 Tax=Kordia zhangzhouensis TaxID=1620405 RepID=UPI000628FFFD|nr:hypothetical protein [Kordia zhangzhouensis]